VDGKLPQPQVTRRRLLKLAAAGTASVGAGTFLASCAAPATISSPTPAPASTKAIQTKALQKVTYMGSFRFSTSEAPWFLARDRGYFAAEGLDVEILEGTGSATTARVVAAGSVTFGLVDGGVIIRSVGTGIPIKAVLGVWQTSASAAIVRRDSGMTKPKDLEGKTLSTGTGSATAQLFPGWMKVNGADADKVTLRVLPPPAENTAFIQGQVAGVLTFITGSLLNIRAAGVDAVPIKYSDFKFNIPSSSLVANAVTIRDHPELVRSFVRAAAKGMADMLKEPGAALEALLKAVPDLAPTRDIVAKSLEVGNALVPTKRTEGKPVGWMADEDWQEAIALLKDYGGLTEVPKLEDVVVNFIPEK
jgi:NitT/TauT family transport system substrate-binding protein